MFRNEVITLATIITNPFENGNASISCCAMAAAAAAAFFPFSSPSALCLMFLTRLIYCQVALMRLFHGKLRSGSGKTFTSDVNFQTIDTVSVRSYYLLLGYPYR